MSAAEKIERAKLKPREIIHENTRIAGNLFVVETDRTGAVLGSQLANARAQRSTGKIGPDGKEILPQQLPTVQGYGYIATPSPAPGMCKLLHYECSLGPCLQYAVECMQYLVPLSLCFMLLCTCIIQQ